MVKDRTGVKLMMVSHPKFWNKRNGSVKMFSLRQQISRILLIIIIIVPILLTIVLTVMIRSYQSERNRKSLDDMAAYAADLDNSIMQLNNVVGSIYSTNTSFQGISTYLSPIKKYDYIYDLLNLLQVQEKANRNLTGLVLFYDNYEKTVYYMDNKIPFGTVEKLKSSGQAAVKDIQTRNYSQFVESAGGIVYYSVFLKKPSAAIGGMVQMQNGLPEKPDNSAIYGIVHDKTFYRTAGSDAELSDVDFTSLLPGRNDAGQRVIYLSPLTPTGMSAVEILPKSPWLYVSVLHIILILLSLVFFIVLLRSYRIVSKQLTMPLEDMSNALSQIQAGVWEVKFSAPNRILEIENVRQAVSRMLKEIEAYKIRSYEEQLDKQKIQLQYLRLQLAPHFYTNCLKNAYYMLALKEYDNVEHFLLCLSTHMRYLLQNDVMMVPLKVEKEFVDNYIDLQKLMTEKPLLCEIIADEATLEKEIPILTLETFVENSIKYARGTDISSLEIQIHVKERNTENGRYLDIMVTDNGHGYPEEILQLLNRKEPEDDSSLGVGIVNLQSRMRICYGKEASWYFDNVPGAFSELIIPEKNGADL